MRCVISFDESIRREIRLSERMGLDIASTSKNRMPFDKAKSAAARRRNEVWNRAQTIITGETASDSRHTRNASRRIVDSTSAKTVLRPALLYTSDAADEEDS